jgi:hypothetical protein
MGTTIFRLLALTALATSILSSAKSLAQEDAWLVLNKITHKRTYDIETRDRKCVSGTITGVTSNGLKAKLQASASRRLPETLTFLRADVLRVGDGQLIYYSGRSSWSDLGSLRVSRDRLKIVTKDGKVYKFKPPYTVSDEGIALEASGKSMNVSKIEIAQVYDMVVMPLSDFGEYSLDELGPMVIFDPDWYAWKLNLERHVPVLLYDASAPEDNSSAQCAAK